MTNQESELLERYPFIQVRRLDDTVIPGQTYLSGIPKGWMAAFGTQMLNDFANAAKEDGQKLDDLRVIDVKEKFGGLRWYWGRTGNSRRLAEVTRLYEGVSQAFCAKCGAHPVMMTRGYILPLCKDCWTEWKKRAMDPDDRSFTPEFPDIHITVHTEDGRTEDTRLPIKELFDRIGSGRDKPTENDRCR